MSKNSYYIYPDVLALRENKLPEEERKRLLRKVAAFVGDPLSLRIMLRMEPEEFAAYYPGMAVSTPSTNETIDKFISTFAPRETPETSQPYFSEKRVAELVGRANSLIRNHDYSGALEIISSLYLNNPEKSIYFADQIRFLKKLIENDKRGSKVKNKE